MASNAYTKSNPRSTDANGQPCVAIAVRNPEDLPDEWMVSVYNWSLGKKFPAIYLNGERKYFVIAANPDRILGYTFHAADGGRSIAMRLEVVKGDVSIRDE